MRTVAKAPTYTYGDAQMTFEEDRAAKANNRHVSPRNSLQKNKNK